MIASLAEAMKAAAEDQRMFQRYRVSMTVLVQTVPEDGDARPERPNPRRCSTTSAVVTDISLTGLVFVASRPFPPGSLVEFQVSLGAQIYNIQATVKRSQVLLLPGRRAFQCAAQFVRGQSILEFIPAIAKYLHHRGSDAAVRPSR